MNTTTPAPGMGPPVALDRVRGLLPVTANLTSLYLLWGGAIALLVVMMTFALIRCVRSRAVLRPTPTERPATEAQAEELDAEEAEELDASFFSTADDAEVAAAAAERSLVAPPSDALANDIARAFRTSSDALKESRKDGSIDGITPVLLEEPVVRRVQSVVVPRRVNSNSLQRQVPHPPAVHRTSSGHTTASAKGATGQARHHGGHENDPTTHGGGHPHPHPHESSNHDLSGEKKSTHRAHGSHSSRDSKHHREKERVRDRERERERERDRERERHRRHRQTSREHK